MLNIFVKVKRFCRSLSRTPKIPGMIAQCDVRPTDAGYLTAKVMVFQDRNSMNRFWRKSFDCGISRNCKGVAKGLFGWTERVDQAGKWVRKCITGDRRYFCVIGLIHGHLNMEVVTHESVHAGLCYAKRATRTPWAKYGDFDEEQIAYPAGRIAARINQFLHKKGLYE